MIDSHVHVWKHDAKFPFAEGAHPPAEDASAEMLLELMKANGLGTRKDVPEKVLAKGGLSKALTVHAHAFSAGARERIEAAGGRCEIVAG